MVRILYEDITPSLQKTLHILLELEKLDCMIPLLDLTRNSAKAVCKAEWFQCGLSPLQVCTNTASRREGKTFGSNG